MFTRPCSPGHSSVVRRWSRSHRCSLLRRRPNGRVLAFLAEDLKGIKCLFPDVKAKRVYCVERFDQTEYCRANLPVDHPFSPVSVAFSKNNEMVIGDDGYYRDPNQRSVRQLYLYRKPLERSTPDAVIELPLGAAADTVRRRRQPDRAGPHLE
ncbi:MAG: hypothetical protein K8U57_24015 [Planctomycetes bacterium]|nr:hypothetical protein [Planctomycetota bacterium]